MNRPAVWVGLHRDQHLRVNIERKYSNRWVCRVTDPGQWLGQTFDFVPDDVVEQPLSGAQEAAHR